ncbi:MAG: carboxyl transferase domain-containing protein [Actinomycetales bacterium]
MFDRVAIVNRGEAAMRLIHAVRELSAESGKHITVIALHVESEQTARFVREADVAYNLGPASARPYLDHAVLEQALVQTQAQAAWVGWGFVAEDPAFADLCERIGVTFVGPSAAAMRQLGDKVGAKLLAEETGVPVAPWSGGEVDSLDEALAAGERLGYPLMLKASAGGGGRGIRKVAGPDEIRAVYQLTRDEAERAFGNPAVFLESLVTGARHVEVQVIADSHGTAWALGVRDCTVQRRNQKVIEESASAVLDEESRQRLLASAERLAVRVGYCGAATVEFLFDPATGAAAFLEVNTRLQVEHPVTELVTGFDLVKAQLHVASGGRLTGDKPTEIGHAVEARLNAEDPDRDFAPAPGQVLVFDLPAGPGIRVDTGLSEADTVPADFDSMIAKIIGYGRNRGEAFARLRRALSDTHVVIDGGATNKSFVIHLLDQPEVLHATADTGWIDRVRAEGALVDHDHSGIALIAAAIASYEDAERADLQRFLATAYGGRPQASHTLSRTFDLRLRQRGHKVQIAQVGPDRYRVRVAEAPAVDAVVERQDAYRARLSVNGHSYRVLVAVHLPQMFVEVDDTTHRVSQDEGGVVRAHAPALVVALPVAEGDEVAVGDPLVVVESMKMETSIPSVTAGRVREVLVAIGHQVEAGAPLVRVEPIAEDENNAAAEPADDTPVDLPEPFAARTDAEKVIDFLSDLEGLILGFDLPGALEAETVSGYRRARSELAAPDDAVLASEINLVTTFTDLTELSRNKPGGDEVAEERVHSTREHFHSYLRSLDTRRESVPESFSRKLSRALDHYGVTELDRTPELEEAVFRIFLALQQGASHQRAVTAVLQHWLAHPAPVGPLADGARRALEELAVAAQVRYPALGDLARSVRFTWFDEPELAAHRAQVLSTAEADLAALSADPQAADRAERVERLVNIPEQLVSFLAGRLEDGIVGYDPMLEVLLGRHYRDHGLGPVETSTHAGHPFAMGDYVLDGDPCRVISTEATIADLQPDSPFVQALSEQVGDGVLAGRDVVIDFYLYWPDAPDTMPTLAQEVIAVLDAIDCTRHVRRLMVGVVRDPQAQVSYLTLRPERHNDEVPDPTAALVEDELVRGVHPMVARRLDLWRLRNFDITRLDATDDVLLYHCVARGNPDDQRLVALAQIRELAVVRDAAGGVIGLPHVQRAVSACSESIRRARAAMGSAGQRLDHNHIWLHLWPIVEVPVSELTGLRHTISPLTAGRGLQEVVAQGDVRGPDGRVHPAAVRFTNQAGHGVVAQVRGPMTERLEPLDGYAQRVLRSGRRGNTYPYELVREIAGEAGTFTEYELDEAGRLAPVLRPPGSNTAGIVVGIASTPTARHPQGVQRVVLLGDPTKALGAVAEPECARVVAALDLATEQRLPVDWYALSAGARISMDSGTENMDWVAKALRRIVEFTQSGGEINVVVAGINVGAQPYWNAEATMLMHTRGVLVMTPDSAMVLTGKQSLDFSGGVSAEDNFGIGGYDRVMGPNGQAQYWAPDLPSAVEILRQHHEHSYVAPGDAGPRATGTTDPFERDVRDYPHAVPDSEFTTVGDIFSATRNPDRKKPFDMRTLMRSVADADHPVLERWSAMADADTSIVLDAHLGGQPVCLIGIESKPVGRRGFPPSDGPDVWTAGTLFPRSSKKTARAINAASGNRPLVVLANLSGFDGSPESMRSLQLEYGAEIGRAVVNFAGPIVFCVVSRYHGGAFVVFSKQLNDSMRVLAVEGSFASVIGGAPAAAVVFAGEVDARTQSDPRVRALEARVGAAQGGERAQLSAELSELSAQVRTEHLSAVAAEFDGVHDIDRAVAMGSVDAVIPARELRPRLISEVAEGLRKGRPGR